MKNTTYFIITIDTEGDNVWKNPHRTETKNANYVSRFQFLCEKFNFKPVWLTNYEMAKEPIFIEFAKDMIKRRSGEIGMHLHAWNTPPYYSLTQDDTLYQSYLVEFPEKIMKEKILHMTHLLEDTFDKKIVSHRAGRWAFDHRYAKLLIECGYRVDCSVTPHMNWKRTIGTPKGGGGTNYQFFPEQAYFINLNDISKPGNSVLLEVPMTIHYKYPNWINILKKTYNSLRGKHYLPSLNWLRPSKKNGKNMISIAKTCLLKKCNHIELMLHSSELMPGGSPYFKKKSEIKKLYIDLEKLFQWLQGKVKGVTLLEFYQKTRRLTQ